MANPYYNVSGAPITGSPGASGVMRGEFAAIAAGFNLLPALTANTAIVVNGTGTGLDNTIGTFALAGNFATTGAFNTTLAQQASVTLTLPSTSDTLVGRATTDTLTNKTLTSPTINTPTITGGTLASITSINNLAITAPASGATLTIADGKTLTASNTLTLAGVDATTITFQGTDTYVGRTTTDTLANKSLTAPAITGGTLAAITGLGLRSTGAAFDLTLATSEVLTAGRTLSIVMGDAARTLTLSGSPSLSGVTITGNSTLATTNGTTMTFPGTSATIARTDAANTFTGTQTIGALVATTINGNTITAGTGTLTIAAGKTATISSTLSFAGTDSTTMTFPSTSATLARTDAANTFTGHQTIEGVTSTGATGTGKFVFDTAPTFSNPIVGTQTVGDTSTKAASTAFVQTAIQRNYVAADDLSPTGTSSATLKHMGLAKSLTLSRSGRVRIVAYGWVTNVNASNNLLALTYGTGTAPVNGASQTGTLVLPGLPASNAAGYKVTFAFDHEVGSLTLATYWFDICLDTDAGTASIVVAQILIEEVGA